MDQYGRPCQHGNYCCLCGDPFVGDILPCNASVGRQNVKRHMNWPPSNFCNTSAADWMCWQTKLSQKLSDFNPGYWYSTLEYGSCMHHPSGPNCTWSVTRIDKIVNQTCHANAFLGAVETYNSSCFNRCGHARNVSSPCWTRCFYTVVLGPDAGRVGGSVAGISLDELIRAWTAPFRSEDPKSYGCPALPMANVVSQVSPSANTQGAVMRDFHIGNRTQIVSSPEIEV